MRRTFVTSMPDKSGAFLKASELFYSLNINILRVSFNKAVDTSTLFIEVEGDSESLNKASNELCKMGYICSSIPNSTVVLISFEVDDTTGDLVKILKLINKYKFNISYINTNETHAGAQNFKMALFVDDNQKFSDFYVEAKGQFSISVIDVDQNENLYDNSIFYKTFSVNLAKNAGLNQELAGKLAVNVNRIMQYLDDRKISPKKTFEIIKNFANHIEKYKGDNFKPRITEYNITKNSKIILIEPPCGSNTAIIKSFNEYLFVDSGYAVYQKEMLKIFERITGDFNKVKKSVFVTHADIDHTGLLHLFDEILVSDKTLKCFELENQNKRSFREQNPMHLPYVKICKLLTHYNPPPLDKIKVIATSHDEKVEPIYKAGTLSFGEFNFDVYFGQGGHVAGETILIDNEHKIAFTGDNYVNLKDYTDEQAEYNKYAPILLSSVDSIPHLAKLQRNELLKILENKNFMLFCGHGGAKIL